MNDSGSMEGSFLLAVSGDSRGTPMSPRTRGSVKSASPLLARGEHWTDQLTSEQLKNISHEQRQKQEAIQEILLAERAYVRDLGIIHKIFMEDMRERGIMTKEEINSIFSNIPTLLEVHNGLLNDLEQLKRENSMISDDGIGRIFLERANLFKHYANYCVNHIGMSQKLATLREHAKVVEFLEECKKNPECRNLSLESFLITPLQRMAKYPLLLKSLLKYMEKDSPECSPLIKAYDEIKNVVDQVNNRAQQEENARTMMELQTAVEQVHGEAYNFCERGRYIVKDGPVRLVRSGKKKSKSGSDTSLFLFNDKCALVKSKMKGKKQGYKVLALWNLNQIIVAPLDILPSSPFSLSLPASVRHRAFSRSSSETSNPSVGSPRLSIILTSSPILYSSPRRSGTNADVNEEGRFSTVDVDDEFGLIRELKVEHGFKIIDKELMTEYRLIVGNSADKDDWIAKMKERKVEFKNDTPPEDMKVPTVPSGAESPSTNSSWERKYHVEVEIRTELKKVLDQTITQMNALREEVEVLKKEKEALKEENERLRNKAWKNIMKKRQPRERGSTDPKAAGEEKSLSIEIETFGGSQIQKAKTKTKFKKEKEKKGEKDKEKEREKEQTKDKEKDKELARIRSRSLGSSFSAEIASISRKALGNRDETRNGGDDLKAPVKEEEKEKEKPKERSKKAKTLGRKSLILPGRITKEQQQPMPFLDLPSMPRTVEDIPDTDGEELMRMFAKPGSARELTRNQVLKPPTATRGRLLSDGASTAEHVNMDLTHDLVGLAASE